MDALAVDRLRFVAHVIAVASFPERETEENEQNCEGDPQAGMSRCGWRVGILAIEIGVPNLADSDDDQDHGPIAGEDRPGIELRVEFQKQEEQADDNEDQPADGRAPPANSGWVHRVHLSTC